MKRLFTLVSFLILLIWLSGCTYQPSQPNGLLVTPIPIRQLIILRLSTKDQPTLVAHISSIATTERLYNTMLRLSQVSSSPQPSPISQPEYQLVFKIARDVPAVIYSKEGLIHFDNDYWLSITDQFEKVFKEILAQATFSPTLLSRS